MSLHHLVPARGKDWIVDVSSFKSQLVDMMLKCHIPRFDWCHLPRGAASRIWVIEMTRDKECLGGMRGFERSSGFGDFGEAVTVVRLSSFPPLPVKLTFLHFA